MGVVCRARVQSFAENCARHLKVFCLDGRLQKFNVPNSEAVCRQSERWGGSARSPTGSCKQVIIREILHVS